MAKHNPKHPMQPVVIDEEGVGRFKRNEIVRYLIDLCTQKGICDMNQLAIMKFSDEDRQQFAQLIGYSVSGYGELSYTQHDGGQYDRAAAEVKNLLKKKKKGK